MEVQRGKERRKEKGRRGLEGKGEEGGGRGTRREEEKTGEERRGRLQSAMKGSSKTEHEQREE